MTVEVVVSLLAAWRAHSVALLAFGSDSILELLSAAVVLLRFRTASRFKEASAAKATGALLLALAAAIVLMASLTLTGTVAPEPSALGITLLVAVLLVMPWLAREKRRLAAVAGSASLRADAVQSAVCMWLAAIALVGLVANAVWHQSWADPVAALAIVPWVVKEGIETIRKSRIECCCD